MQFSNKCYHRECLKWWSSRKRLIAESLSWNIYSCPWGYFVRFYLIIKVSFFKFQHTIFALQPKPRHSLFKLIFQSSFSGMNLMIWNCIPVRAFCLCFYLFIFQNPTAILPLTWTPCVNLCPPNSRSCPQNGWWAPPLNPAVRVHLELHPTTPRASTRLRRLWRPSLFDRCLLQVPTLSSLQPQPSPPLLSPPSSPRCLHPSPWTGGTQPCWVSPH